MSGAPSEATTPVGPSGSMTVTGMQAGPSVLLAETRPTLRLRAESHSAQNRRVVWAEDVVDNEGMGKKSSKVCCIYHKPKNAGDSSSDESSSESESSDSEPDLSRAQPPRRRRDRRQPDGDHDHDGIPTGDSDNSEAPSERAKGKSKLRDTSPNAYERAPRSKKDKT